ncbi:alpha/beta hydrolase family protein [Epilithonimonas lactis]|uniref:Alpha/beta hydrolase n=1 Tax=Epilithonimonas lactis TaxID=421072 RepID=A0A085BFN5_9FLAO|nr:dienelactone hydrolase family protein [Epilithonimonas lactis]KFC21280.1 alpha/beta hydrolase [Epilithonimonas lactis]SEP79595.1 Prolyl oligopeptidase family protein [Epilithonimonas lactis]
MNLIKQKNIVLKGEREFLADAFFPESEEKLPLIIFVHGYKGYKDWGTWKLMGEKLANAGFYFVKFNMSHNGTTIEDPNNFGDLEAFGQNNYSKELDDLEIVIDHFKNQKEVDAENITLLGHSRGGGSSIVKASENKSITKLMTLASVSTLDRFPKDEAFENWKRDGVYFIENARTKQKMPHYFQFYKDYENNRERFDIEESCKNLKISALFIHGTDDEAVAIDHSENLHHWTKDSQFKMIEKTGHTFGAKEPWESDILPKELDEAVEMCIDFLKS